MSEPRKWVVPSVIGASGAAAGWLAGCDIKVDLNVYSPADVKVVVVGNPVDFSDAQLNVRPFTTDTPNTPGDAPR